MTRKMQQLWLERRLAVLGLEKVKDTESKELSGFGFEV